MTVDFAAAEAGFEADAFLVSVLESVAADATASKAKGLGVMESVAFVAIAEGLAGLGGGGEIGATGLGARAFLASVVGLEGPFFIRAGEGTSMALFAAGNRLLFLLVSFAEFIFQFNKRMFLAVKSSNPLLPSSTPRTKKQSRETSREQQILFAIWPPNYTAERGSLKLHCPNAINPAQTIMGLVFIGPGQLPFLLFVPDLPTPFAEPVIALRGG